MNILPVIVIFGANGFLGRYLCRYFKRRGKEVVAIGRSRNGWSGDGMFLEWDGETLGPWALSLEAAEAVINLAGASVNCRYTEANKHRILTSRETTTRLIGKAIRDCRIPPKAWLNASTATWYRYAEDRPQDDWLGEHGDGFSCKVARRWEEALFETDIPAVTRKVALRIGMVLANEKGTVFDVLRGLATRGLGGTMGPGTQKVSWIHMDDFLRAVDFILQDPFLEGALNITAPDFPTNREWMRHFREMAGMPIGIPVKRWMMGIGARILQTEPELVLKSRWAEPLRLRDAGFRWRWRNAGPAIVDLQHREGLDGFFKEPWSRSLGSNTWIPGMCPSRAGR